MSSRKSSSTNGKSYAAPAGGSSSGFLFVEVAPTGKALADKDLRTSIQKHVMKGVVRVRKTRNCANKIKVDSEKLPICKKNENPGSEQTQMMIEQSIFNCEVSRGVCGSGRTNPFARYPIEINLEILFLLDHVFTCPHPYLTPFRDSWLALSLEDLGSFQEVLSNLASHVAKLVDRTVYQEQAAKHHAAAVRSVNTRLSDPVERISDGVVQSVITFACFSHSTGDWQAYDTHMAGLKTIMDIRGGLKSIDNHKILRVLLAGLDVASANFRRRPTHFSLSDKYFGDLESPSSKALWALPGDGISALWERSFPDDVVLPSIFADICTLNMMIKYQSTAGRPPYPLWMSSTFIPQFVLPLTYRLVASSIELDSITPDNYMNECCRLSAFILLAKVRHMSANSSKSPLTRHVLTNLENASLRVVLTRYYLRWTYYQPLLLWVCVMGALSVERERDRMWWLRLVTRTATAMGFSGKDGWSEAVTLLRGNPLWIGEVLDGEFQIIGREVILLLPWVAISDDLQLSEDLLA